jgi:hypothetical protein
MVPLILKCIVHLHADQPGGLHLMPVPPPIAGIPPGLEYLTTIDQLLVHQQVELLEGTCSVSASLLKNTFTWRQTNLWLERNK